MATTSSDAEWAYQELRRLIIQGAYEPGTRLVESKLAEELGVSRTPIREALTRTATEGLVLMYPNRGAVVRTFTHDDLIEIFDLRAVLEGFAAYKAAVHITPEQMSALEKAVAALDAIEDKQFTTHDAMVECLVDRNADFHQTIITASQQHRLAELLRMVVSLPLQFRSFYWYTRNERDISNFFHKTILRALKTGDADRARSVMQEHIYFGRDFLLDSLEETR